MLSFSGASAGVSICFFYKGPILSVGFRRSGLCGGWIVFCIEVPEMFFISFCELSRLPVSVFHGTIG